MPFRIRQALLQILPIIGVCCKVSRAASPAHRGPRLEVIQDTTSKENPNENTIRVEVCTAIVALLQETLRRDVPGASGWDAKGPSPIGICIEPPKAEVRKLGQTLVIDDNIVRLKVAQQCPHLQMQVLKCQEDLAQPLQSQGWRRIPSLFSSRLDSVSANPMQKVAVRAEFHDDHEKPDLEAAMDLMKAHNERMGLHANVI
mmetsp:Transcript_74848/g.136778  ORF Transcript_74848/g.136778 Transcript_74848/m.136778 type:complete len:201 (-) Transcript_74848:2525-3127(-)